METLESGTVNRLCELRSQHFGPHYPGDVPESTTAPSDGRRARRERNRTAVVDAMFELIREGDLPPSVGDVAARAGVSVSSVFRYFENLDDLHRETVRRYFERYAPLFDVPGAPDGSTEDRIAAWVDARLDLYETIGPIARLSRVRALDHPQLAEALAETRQGFADQARDHFRPELDACTPADADDRVALVDALTSFESWDLLQGTHDRTRAQLRRAWVSGLSAVLAPR